MWKRENREIKNPNRSKLLGISLTMDSFQNPSADFAMHYEIPDFK